MEDSSQKEAPMRHATRDGDIPPLFPGVEMLPKCRSAALRVVYATDQGFVKPTLVSMMSLLENASRDVDILVIGHNLSSGAVTALKRVEERYHNAVVHNIAISDDMLSMTNWSPAFERFSPVILSRLYIPTIFETGRVLYLDSDTFVRGDVSPLFDMDMDGMLIAAVRDFLALEFRRNRLKDPRLSEVAEVMGDRPPTEYFNSGMVVFDCGSIAECGFAFKLLDKLKSHREYKWPDQDILNEVFSGRTKLVSQEWGADHGCIDEVRNDDCRIVHYASEWKPWDRIPPVRMEMPGEIDRGMSALLYRLHANRLLEGLLGSDADVMGDLGL